MSPTGAIERWDEVGRERMALNVPFVASTLPRFVAMWTSSPLSNGKDQSHVSIFDLDSGPTRVLPIEPWATPKLVGETWIIQSAEYVALVDGRNGALLHAYATAGMLMSIGSEDLWLVDPAAPTLSQLALARIDAATGEVRYRSGNPAFKDATARWREEVER